MDKINSNEIQSDLQFKRQEEFWDEYMRLRKEANSSLTNIYYTLEPAKDVKRYLRNMSELLNWSSSYQTKSMDKAQTILLIKDLVQLNSTWKDNPTLWTESDEVRENFICDCQDFWDKVAEEHKKQELLPRPEEFYEEDNVFLKEIKAVQEESMKQMLNGFYDIFKTKVESHKRK